MESCLGELYFQPLMSLMFSCCIVLDSSCNILPFCFTQGDRGNNGSPGNSGPQGPRVSKQSVVLIFNVMLTWLKPCQLMIFLQFYNAKDTTKQNVSIFEYFLVK